MGDLTFEERVALVESGKFGPEELELRSDEAGNWVDAPYARTSVDELVDLIDNQPLTAFELEAANAELEVALKELTPTEALDDIQSYVELTEGARGRALEADVDALRKFLEAQQS